MAKKPENTFIDGIHRQLPPPSVLHREGTHGGIYGSSGRPDMWYSGRKADLWVEYKFAVLPKRESTQIVFGLTPLQQRWIEQRRIEGRNAWVIVGSKDGGVVFSGTLIEDLPLSMPLSLYLSRMLSKKEIAQRITEFCG